MAMRLLYSTRTLDRDADKNRRGGVTYYADGATTAAAAVAMWDADSGGTLKVHPDDPTIPFDGISVSPLSNGAGYNVTARFSTNRSGRFNQGPPVDEPDWHSWERGRRRGEAEIAMNRREWVKPDAGTATPFQVWKLGIVKTPEVYARRTLKFRLKTQIQSIFDVIDTSLGDIHRFPGGVYWQFVDADTKPIDATTWEVSYTWEYDRGTPYPDPSFGEDFGIAEPLQDAQFPPWFVFGGQYWRPAYCRVGVPITPQNPRVQEFGVVFVQVGKRNDDGWQLLPGSNFI